LQTVSKCRSVFMSCVLFEHCFIIELFGEFRSHDRQFKINTYSYSPLSFGKEVIISWKRCKIETWWQWKSNRKSHVVYRMAPVPVALNDLESHFCLWKPF